MITDLIENLSQIEILGLTLIGEARGEPIETQVAIGSTIRNRLHNEPAKYHNYSHVCLEINQFPCWNADNGYNHILLELASKLVMGQRLTDPIMRQCMLIASGIIDWSIIDNTSMSLFIISREEYYNSKPAWVKNLKLRATRGDKIFLS